MSCALLCDRHTRVAARRAQEVPFCYILPSLKETQSSESVESVSDPPIEQKYYKCAPARIMVCGASDCICCMFFPRNSHNIFEKAPRGEPWSGGAPWHSPPPPRPPSPCPAPAPQPLRCASLAARRGVPGCAWQQGFALQRGFAPARAPPRIQYVGCKPLRLNKKITAYKLISTPDHIV